MVILYAEYFGLTETPEKVYGSFHLTMNASPTSTLVRSLVYRSFSRTSKHKIFLGLTLLALFIVFVVARTLPSHKSAEYALTQIRDIKSSSDIIAHKDYMTEQGADTLRVLMPILEEFPLDPTFSQVVYWPRAGETTAGPQTSDFCTIQFSGEKTAGQLVFKHNEVWQLNDVYVSVANGQNLNLTVSAISGPLQALENALAEKTKESVDADNLNFTEKGKRVRLQIISNGSQGSEHSSWQVKVPTVDEHTAAFPVTNGHDELQFRIVNNSGWRYDDVYVVKLDNQSVNLTISEMMDHPILSFFHKLFN